MFLSILNREKKKLFLELCKHAALSDNFFSSKQRLIIELYSNEMGFKHVDLETIDYELDYIIEELAKTTTKYEKREILIEIIALLFSNFEINPMESEFLTKLASGFSISDEKLDDMVKATSELLIAQSNLKKSMDD